MTTVLDPEAYTLEEHKLLWLLAQVEGDDCWSIGINRFMKEPEEGKFRQLIKDLKSQINDNPSGMMKILGEECFDLICRI